MLKPYKLKPLFIKVNERALCLGPELLNAFIVTEVKKVALEKGGP
jgi:hypothetical protein